MNKYLAQLSLFVSICLGGATAFAGGPLNLAGSAGHTPVAYPNGGQNITMNLDQGNLGSRTKAQTDALLTQAFGLWNNVSTTTVALNRGADLSVDVTAANYSTYLSQYSDGLNPVIYDTDGSITDDLFGVGAKNSILGFAGSAYFSLTATYAEGEAVINGFLSISDNTLVVVLTHELGHFVGLDHTQLDNTQGLVSSNYALMYPIAYRTLTSLHEDDTAAISALYPTGISAAYGTLTGVFTQVNVTPILGANIWVKETTTGKVYSCVSDFLKEGTGFYRLLLPPGTYTLNAESIQTNFTGGSSVGPYADSGSDISFQAPHPITPVAFKDLASGQTNTFKITAGCSANITFKLDGSGNVVSTTCLNNAPVAQNGVISTPSNTPVNGIAAATDQDGDTLTYRIVNQGTRGTTTMNAATGAFTYTPQANVTGSDSFTFAANDGTVDSNTATISVTITNTPPNITALTATPQTLLDNATSQLQVVASDTDGPSALSYTWTILSGGGSLNNSATANPIYTPANVSASTSVTINVAVSDGAAIVNRSITLTVNDASSQNIDFVWVEDAVPSGGILAGTSEGWNFISTNPAPFSGALAHQSGLVAGIHQHYFFNATDKLSISTGDTLFAYVYLDASNPPSEVMLQWHEPGGWEHRAYWGANSIPWGVDGTVSRKYIGPLPAAGGWVRLEVPASAVGLAGVTIDGMAYTLFNGRATWDRAGKTSAPTPLALSTTTLPAGTVGSSYNQTLAATGGTPPYTWSITSGSLPAGLNLNGTTGVISGTPTTVGTSNFTVRVSDAIGASVSQALTLNINAASADFVWVEDAVPSGGILAGTSEGWNFISTNPAPFSGALAHQSGLIAGIHQHYFFNATDKLSVSTGDTLFAYVYLDASNPPSEVMLQWHEPGGWEHRAYWGANSIPWGVDGTVSRKYMGPLPAAGGWVRLEVPASAVGLEGVTIDGMAYSLFNGRATWDRAGKTSP
ncbi:MAG: Ig-like domain-containing protein [Burkholderiales bacterium]|nr:Ig-like domain-containing protein [Burkholderiales bacterium]